MTMALSSGMARAVDPAIACKADKMRRAGLYDLCLLKVNARALKAGTAVDTAKCDAAFAAAWARVETRGEGACPTNGDASTIGAQVRGDVTGIITALTPTTSTTTTTLATCGIDYPGCGGACPAGLSCWATVSPPATTSCTCLPSDPTPCEDTGGPLTSGPHCGGACPSGQVCSTLYVDDTTLSFSCGCMPEGQRPCLSFAAATCGGACPTAMTCGTDPLGLFLCRCQ